MTSLEYRNLIDEITLAYYDCEWKDLTGTQKNRVVFDANEYLHSNERSQWIQDNLYPE
jgi:hypothetical protein